MHWRGIALRRRRFLRLTLAHVVIHCDLCTGSRSAVIQPGAHSALHRDPSTRLGPCAGSYLISCGLPGACFLRPVTLHLFGRHSSSKSYLQDVLGSSVKYTVPFASPHDWRYRRRMSQLVWRSGFYRARQARAVTQR